MRVNYSNIHPSDIPLSWDNNEVIVRQGLIIVTFIPVITPHLGITMR